MYRMYNIKYVPEIKNDVNNYFKKVYVNFCANKNFQRYLCLRAQQKIKDVEYGREREDKRCRIWERKRR